MLTTQTQYVRVYSTPIKNDQPKKTDKKRPSDKKSKTDPLRDVFHPWGGLTLTFDTETTAGTSQQLRFGWYEIHGLTRDEIVRRYVQDTLKPQDADILRECGLFYNPETHLLQQMEFPIDEPDQAKGSLRPSPFGLGTIANHLPRLHCLGRGRDDP
ncbi:MAG TPA: hypothetical protein VGE97_10210, partial [Nitrososphaera sp.]